MHKIEGTPSLRLLAHFPMKAPSAEHLNIIQKTSNSYAKLGMFLLNDDNCDIIYTLKERHNNNPEEITMAIYKQWISGSAKEPTWQTLVEVFKVIGLNNLARDIENTLTLQHTFLLSM